MFPGQQSYMYFNSNILFLSSFKFISCFYAEI